ncbi:MAG: hypothetical protein JRJ29_01530 [Deltaproteobacteria bacterium]|nr:hypothetical protein [Deltaproteobacteria bacterium]
MLVALMKGLIVVAMIWLAIWALKNLRGPKKESKKMRLEFFNDPYEEDRRLMAEEAPFAREIELDGKPAWIEEVEDPVYGDQFVLVYGYGGVHGRGAFVVEPNYDWDKYDGHEIHMYTMSGDNEICLGDREFDILTTRARAHVWVAGIAHWLRTGKFPFND